MNAHEKNRNLDELITNTFGRDDLQFDFNKWKKDHIKEINTFKSQKNGQEKSHIHIYKIGRIIMKSPITKFAAVITVAFFSLFMILFSKTSHSAYAIQQTLDALEKVTHMHVVMYNEQGKITDERWIEIGTNGFQKRYYQKFNMFDMNTLVVDDTNTCSVYYADKNTVVLYDSNQKQYQWFGNLKELLINLAGRGETNEIEIKENVDYWGIPAHHIRLVELNLDCYIDQETKLPIAVGPSHIDYEELPKDIFSFTMPSGAEVIDIRAGDELPEWLQDENLADKYFYNARIALSNKDYLQAIDLFTYVIEIQPQRNWAIFWLGKSYEQIDDYDSAISTYTKLIELFKTVDYEAPYCYLARGSAFKAKGLIETAKSDYSRTLPTMIKSLRNIKEAHLFDYADDPLYRDLPDNERPSEAQCFAMMIERLREVTGENFGYNPDSSPEEMEQIITSWEHWWQQNKDSYQTLQQ